MDLLDKYDAKGTFFFSAVRLATKVSPFANMLSNTDGGNPVCAFTHSWIPPITNVGST